MAPFCEFLALVILDGDFDLPQHQLAGLADGRSKGGDGLRGVEIKDVQKILMLEVISRLHPAAGQQRIGGADNGGVPKSGSDVELIIVLQKRAVNDADNIAPIVVPVFIYVLYCVTSLYIRCSSSLYICLVALLYTLSR